jgi:hypothetical protein
MAIPDDMKRAIVLFFFYFIVYEGFNSHSPFDADLYDSDGYFLNRMIKSKKVKFYQEHFCSGIWLILKSSPG